MKLLDSIYSKMGAGVSIDNDWEIYKRNVCTPNNNATKVMVYFGPWCAAYWRVFVPMMHLAKDPRYDIKISAAPLWNTDNIDWADVVLFYRTSDANVISQARRIKGAKGIWFDTDDHVHGLPTSHPNYEAMLNSRQLHDMDSVCDIADVITVSTPYLKGLYERRYRTKIEVLPNCVRKQDHRKSRSRYVGEKVIAWAGSIYHDSDLAMIVPAIKEIICNSDNIRLLTINYTPINSKDLFVDIPRDRRWHFTGTYPHLVSDMLNLATVSIAPLCDNGFNRAKSNVKYLEAGMLDVPLIASDLEPYRYDSDIELVKNSTDKWISVLQNALERDDYGIRKRYRDTVLKKYSIDDNIFKWQHIIDSIKK